MRVPLQCQCGKLRFSFETESELSHNRTVCYCDDCQAFAHHLGQASRTLDVQGGSDIYPGVPSNLKIDAGERHLKCLRLTAKGPLRWYADCCKTPIANTSPSRQMPYFGLMHNTWSAQDDDAFGPVVHRIFGKFALGEPPPGTAKKFPVSMIFTVMSGIARARWHRRQAPTPFFDDAGKPVVVPYVLTAAELQAAKNARMSK